GGPHHRGSVMTRIFDTHGRGTRRLTLCIGTWAVKLARNSNGRRCNRFEADLWIRTPAARRNTLCPVLARLPFGLAVIMQRARPLSEDEAERLRNTRGFPDWDYVRRMMNVRSNSRLPIGGGCQMVDSLRWTIRCQRLIDGNADPQARLSLAPVRRMERRLRCAVGRIFKSAASPVGTPWFWTLAYSHLEDRWPNHGYGPTREAAMAAFAKSWRRE